MDNANARRCREVHCDKPITPQWEPGATIAGYAAERAAANLAGFCSTGCSTRHAITTVQLGCAWWQKDGGR